MGVPEPVFVGVWSKFYVFKHFPTIFPRLWIGKGTSCSKISQKLLQKTRSADQSYRDILEKMKQKCGRMLQIIRSEKSKPFIIAISKLYKYEEVNDVKNSFTRILLASEIEFC